MHQLSSWLQQADVPALPPDQVHVWLLRLPEAGTGTCEAVLGRLLPKLSGEERARAAKFLVAPARVQFVVARAALRYLAGQYLNSDSNGLVFMQGERGKPAFRDHQLEFNVSHSGRVALIAFAKFGQVGVDVEQVWEREDPYALAERFFSAAEVAALSALPVDDRRRAFFWIWTRKEAYIKVRGDGLHLALNSFDVTCGPDPSPSLRASRQHPADVQRLCMFNIAVDDEYPASLIAARLLDSEQNCPGLQTLELPLEFL